MIKFNKNNNICNVYYRLQTKCQCFALNYNISFYEIKAYLKYNRPKGNLVPSSFKRAYKPDRLYSPSLGRFTQ